MCWIRPARCSRRASIWSTAISAIRCGRALTDLGDLAWVHQAEQLGTGHAVRLAMAGVPEDARVLVLYGDVPLIRVDTLSKLLAVQTPLAALVTQLENPYGYGRVIRDGIGRVRAIVEEKDCTPEQRTISWVNSGILAADARRLRVWINNLTNENTQGEYYLTDMFSQANDEGEPAEATQCINPQEVFGANDAWQLAALERLYQRLRATTLAAAGVRFADPVRFDIRGDVRVGRDVEIDIDVVLEGLVELGDDVRIGPFCRVRNSTLAAGTVVHSHCNLDGVVTHGPAISARSRGCGRAPSSQRTRTSAISSKPRRRASARTPRRTIFPTSATPRSAPTSTSAPARSPATTTASPSTRRSSRTARSSAPTPRWLRRCAWARMRRSARAR